MRIRRLEVRNFRGIRELDWRINESLVCLVGSGDSRKTTILSALDMLFSRIPSSIHSDSVFWQCEVNNAPAQIRAIVDELPREIKIHPDLGAKRCGIDNRGDLYSEPLNELDDCIFIQLSINQDSTSEWSVLDHEGTPVGRIGGEFRQALGFGLIDSNASKHLTLGRGSNLAAQLSDWLDGDRAVVNALRGTTLSEAVRDSLQFPQIESNVSSKARYLGSYHLGGLELRFSPEHGLRGGAIALTDLSGVPLSLSGNGTAKLAAIAVQEARFAEQSITAIDEVETGLEPHRLSRLLEHLQRRVASGGQVIITTHSPRVIEHLGPKIRMVREEEGLVTIAEFPEEPGYVSGGIRALARTHPAAFLARRLIVVEGQTEMGFLRELQFRWNDSREGDSYTTSSLGIEFIPAKGDADVKSKVEGFKNLGFTVAAVLDADNPNAHGTIRKLIEMGVSHVTPPSGMAIEDVVFSGLNITQIKSLLKETVEVQYLCPLE